MIARILQQFFAPLTLALQNRSTALVLLDELGWTLDESFDIAALGPILPVLDDLDALTDEIERYDSGQASELEVAAQAVLLAESVYSALAALQTMAEDGGPFSLIAPLETAGFWREFALDLPEYLVLTYLRTYLKPVHAALALGGCIGTEPRPGGRRPREMIDWAALRALLDDPAGHLATEYNWGGSLRHQILLDRFASLLGAVNIASYHYDLPQAIAADRFGGLAPGGVGALGAPVLERARAAALARLIEASDDDPTVGLVANGALDALLVPVPAEGDIGDPTGLLLTLRAFGEVAMALDLGAGWSLTPEAALDVSGALGIELQPTGVGLATGAPAGMVGLTLAADRSGDPMTLLGQASGTRIELARLSALFRADFAAGNAEMRTRLGFDGLNLVIAPGEGDGFVASALGDAQIAIPLDFALTWSPDTGLEFDGGTGPRITIPLNLDLGPLDIASVAIAVEPDGNGIALAAGATATLGLGPLKVNVDDIGFRLTATPEPRTPGGSGRAVTVTAGFKPPQGLGLTIGTPDGPISGGGYLYIDRAAGRYEGTLNLKLVKIDIFAAAILDTQALDGAWSMFFALFVEFPSLQLGFGISLEGLGGVAGINRSLDPDALLDAVRSGALGDVLFPDPATIDPPAIIAAYRDIFQPAAGRFLFGPAIKIAWAKGVVEAELAVVIELPTPIVIAVLGSISVMLPPRPDTAAPVENDAPEPAIIALRLDAAGVFDMGAGTIAVEAHLIDSAIAGFPIGGGMAMRARFAGEPYFLLALGGFHPAFPQPAGFPTVERLSMSIAIAGVIDIGFEAYFAIASNTVQFGAAIHLLADIEIFAIEGGFGFDALFAFDPLHVQIALDMYVSVRAAGIDLVSVRLSGTADGPKPWIISAIAEVDIVGYREGIAINRTTGDVAEEPAVAPPELFEMMIAALNAPGALEAVAPDDPAVILRDSAEADAATPAVAPNATLAVRQSVAPLATEIDRFGTNTQIQHDRFALAVDAGPNAMLEPAQDWFAPGQFRDLGATDAAKLSAPSFERLAAGWTISGPAQAPAARGVTRDHKVVRLDGDAPPDAPVPPALPDGLDGVIGSTRARGVATSSGFDPEIVTGVAEIAVAAPVFVPVASASGQADFAQAGSYTAVAAAAGPETVLVRAFEAEVW